MKQQQSSLTDIEHGAKLPALKQLLLDSGIGQQQQHSASISSITAADSQQQQLVSQHRALIFCQLKAMLDIVEKDLLRAHLPTVTYVRLDGSVPASQRHSVVARFNADPSIDVLLLTTQVGGLGLNLTGADTVIFVEHDWNPMKDLQAMDRAHRIGQKKVVNVYRLITRNTLEEKIMGLQKFKLLTANTVISTENASMETMGTDQVATAFFSSYYIFLTSTKMLFCRILVWNYYRSFRCLPQSKYIRTHSKGPKEYYTTNYKCLNIESRAIDILIKPRVKLTQFPFTTLYLLNQ